MDTTCYGMTLLACILVQIKLYTHAFLDGRSHHSRLLLSARLSVTHLRCIPHRC